MGSDGLLGEVLALCSAASFALSSIVIARTGQSGGDRGVMFSVLMTTVLAGLLWLGLEAFDSGVPNPADNGFAIAAFAIAGILAMVFGRTLVFESVRRLGVARSTAVKRLNPFFSVALATLFLGETLERTSIAAMVLIAGSFALLINESLRTGRDSDLAPPMSAYGVGVASALAYALAYIVRKIGLDAMSAPAFGTMVSAVTGFVVFAALSLVSQRHRANFTGMFRALDRWVVSAAILISCGQLFLFAALAYETVSTVVMIASLEIFIAIFLASVILRTEAQTRTTLIAAVMAMVGVVLIAA